MGYSERMGITQGERGGDHFHDIRTVQQATYFGVVDAIAVTDQITRCCLAWERGWLDDESSRHGG